jgi:hypothetical protein
MVGERYAKGATSPIEPRRRFAAFSHGAPPWGLQIPSRPRAIPAQFSQSPMCSMRHTKLPFRPRGPELGPARHGKGPLCCVPVASQPAGAWCYRTAPCLPYVRAAEACGIRNITPGAAGRVRPRLSQHLDVQNNSIVRVQARLQARPWRACRGSRYESGRMDIGSR